jgi:FkbM family methyltransferase
VAPAGALEIWHARHGFARLHAYPGSSVRAAASPRLRRLARTSLVNYLPPEVLTRPSLVVDVGAYVGEWSEGILELLRPQRLVALEPSPESFRELQDRLGRWPNVELHEVAAGRSVGHATLHVGGAGDLDSLFRVREGVDAIYGLPAGATHDVEVEVRPLDDVLRGHGEVALLKLDVQGAERDALAGAAETLQRTLCVSLETNFVSHYEGDTLFPELYEVMRSAGFDFHTFAEPLHRDQRDGRLLFADAVFVRR